MFFNFKKPWEVFVIDSNNNFEPNDQENKK